MQQSSGPSYPTSTLDPHWTHDQEDYQQPAEELYCNHGGRSRVKLMLPVLISGLLLLTVVITTHVIAYNTGYFEKTCQTADGVSNFTDHKSRCKSDWTQHGRKCYYFSNSSLTWYQSHEECVRMKSHLALIINLDEQRFLMNKIQPNMKNHEDKFWIGLTDRHKEGEWRWVDNSKLNTSQQFWVHHQPDNWKGKENRNPEGENCARMGRHDFDGKDATGWFDAHCHRRMKFICETQAYL